MLAEFVAPVDVCCSVAPTSALDDLARLCRSFAGDTEVLMADGTTKPISSVGVGDEVWALDPETGDAAARTVIAVWPHQDSLLEFNVDGGSVTTTEDHHFWNVTDNAWQETQHIDQGDFLLSAAGGLVQARGLDWSTMHDALAYDLSVARTHSYFVVVGSSEVLVHNQGCEDYAREARDIIGGDIYRIEAPGRLRLGSEHPLDVDGAWRHHEFVVKDGLVYDQHYNGIGYDLYMEQFPYLDALTLSKVD